jgi:protein-S-isoprenylcysteine O-methyltransferase Ste14
MGIEGAGPKIMAPAALYFVIVAIVSYVYRPMFDMTFLPREITLVLAALFLVVGIPLWLAAVVYFLLAYTKGEMATKGPYALMPNPIYSSWTVFVFPAIALLLNWWLLLGTPIVMYAAFRMFIKAEDNFMQHKYGRKYEEYRQKVLFNFL